jgi:hypothetical protein
MEIDFFAVGARNTTKPKTPKPRKPKPQVRWIGAPWRERMREWTALAGITNLHGSRETKRL